MVILLDRSGSMSGTKWTQAKAAITDIVNDWDDQVSFGFDVFPDGSYCDGYSDYCGVLNPVVRTCSYDNAANIITSMNSYSASGGWTPLYCAMAAFNSAATYAGACVGTDVETYLVIVSDGADTCTQNCTSANCESGSSVTAASLGTLAASLYSVQAIKSIAIGFGSGAPVAQLEAIATNGGMGLADGYFPATDGAALEAALNVIVSNAVTCVYEVDDPAASADPDAVNFYFDGDVVVNIDIADCATEDGWAWTDSSHQYVEFCGVYCDQITGGTVTDISAQFGCPSVVE
jgi:hypothetical protein